ncbi:hypothetical protein GCM10022233_09790 [Streptomyces shaanxiensis]|uniref:Uncharacterized protein n=1 Tax=Streptomyces shaanxiensis TaxID=653357 RepID=A0ABP7UGZ5_9ACTN
MRGVPEVGSSGQVTQAAYTDPVPVYAASLLVVVRYFGSRPNSDLDQR